MKRISLVTLATFSLLVFPALAQEAEPPPGMARIGAQLPADPVLVWALFDTEPAATWDKMLEMARKFVPEEELAEMTTGLAEFDSKLGMSLRDDLLAQIGPELVVAFDLPLLDEAMGQMMSGSASSQDLLDGIGFVVGVRDSAALEASLAQLFGLGEAVVSQTDGLHRARFPTGSAESEGMASQVPVEHLDVFYSTRGGLMALGFSSDWVRGSLTARPEGERLVDGSDFQRVFSHLDREPESMTYINVPKIVERVMGSEFVSGLLEASDEAQPFLEMIQSPELTGMGVGSTTITVDGGTRSMAFGPSALAGGGAQLGIVAAIVIPNLLDAVDKGKQKRTVADMRNVSTALMSFVVDQGRFPGPTAGWVPLSSLDSALVPDYLASLPGEDGWGNPYQYLSDGETFRLSSAGKDGIYDEDLAAADAVNIVFDGYDGDLLIVDGAFVRQPARAAD